MTLLHDALPPELDALLIPEPNSGCWLYVGTRLSRNGYARKWWAGKERQLHRIVRMLILGPYPPAHVHDHRCRVRSCCNPWHGEPVTVRVNTRRGEAVLYGDYPLTAATAAE